MSTTPNIAPVVFSPELVRRVGPISAVLDLFLNEQMRRIQREINREFTGANPLAVRKVLNQLVTLDGTKIPRKVDDLELRNIRPEVIQAVLKKLVDARILRIADERYELAHDTLARTINEGRSAEELELIRIRKIVEGRLRDYPSTKTLLNAKELRLYRQKRAELVAERPLGAAAERFVRRSRQVLIRRRLGIGLIVALLVTGGFFFLLSRQQLDLAKNWSDQARDAQTAEQNYNYELSRVLYANVTQLPAYTFAFGETEIRDTARTKLRELDSLIELKPRFEQLLLDGDSLHRLGRYGLLEAHDRYRKARALDYAPARANRKLDLLENEMETEFGKILTRIQKAQAPSEVTQALEYARTLNTILRDSTMQLIERTATERSNDFYDLTPDR